MKRLAAIWATTALILTMTAPAGATVGVIEGDCPGGNSGFAGYFVFGAGIVVGTDPVDRNMDYWICVKELPNGKIVKIDNNVKLGKGSSVFD